MAFPEDHLQLMRILFHEILMQMPLATETVESELWVMNENL